MTTDTLDLPPITDAVPEVAPPAGPATAVDLKKVDLQAVALAQFGDWRTDVAAARKNLGTLALDLSIPARIAEAKSLRERVINAPRAQVRKVSKALKSKLTAVSKAVGAEEEAAVAAYDETEKLITPQIEAAEQRIEDERLAKLRADEDRRKGLRDAVDAILAAWVARSQAEGMTSERLAAGIQAFKALKVPEELAEVDAHWFTAHASTLSMLDHTYLELRRREVEAEQAKVRAEQQRVAGIQARIAEIQAAATGHDRASSVDLIEAGLIVDALDVSEDVYQEFTALAQAAKAATLATLKALADAALAREEAEEEAAEAQAAEAARQQEEEAARMRAQVPAANVATAAATEGKAEDPEPGTLEAAPVETLGVTAQHAQEGVAENPLQPQPVAFVTAGDVAAVSEAVAEAPASTDDSTAPGVIILHTEHQLEEYTAIPAGVLTEAPLIRGELGKVDAGFRIVASTPQPACEFYPAAAATISNPPWQGDDGPLETSEAEARPWTPSPFYDTPAPAPAPVIDPRDVFVALVMTAFDCKFPSHPKPSQEWWARVRAAGEALTR